MFATIHGFSRLALESFRHQSHLLDSLLCPLRLTKLEPSCTVLATSLSLCEERRCGNQVHTNRLILSSFEGSPSKIEVD